MNHDDSSPRILLATDGSAAARAAETWVDRLRWHGHPCIDVVTVASRGSAGLGWNPRADGSVPDALQRVRQAEVLAAQRASNEAGARLQGRGRTVRSWAREGDCPEELLAAIDEVRPDLVVLGPRGRSGLAAGILGSVTGHVVSNVGTTILVARPPGAAHGALPKHALVLVDGTPAAERGVRWLTGTGWLEGCRLTLLGLVGRRTGLEPDGGSADDSDGLVRPEAMEILERIAAPVTPVAGSLGFELRGGHPLAAALQALDDVGADLVVVARPGLRPGRAGLAERVAAYAPASVLLVTARP